MSTPTDCVCPRDILKERHRLFFLNYTEKGKTMHVNEVHEIFSHFLEEHPEQLHKDDPECQSVATTYVSSPPRLITKET